MIEPHEIRRVNFEEMIRPGCGCRFDAQKSRESATNDKNVRLTPEMKTRLLQKPGSCCGDECCETYLRNNRVTRQDLQYRRNPRGHTFSTFFTLIQKPRFNSTVQSPFLHSDSSHPGPKFPSWRPPYLCRSDGIE